MVFTIECSNHSNIMTGGCSSIGRTTVCGTVSSLFKSEYPPLDLYTNVARIVQLVRTLISCIKNENSNFSPGYCTTNKGISSIGGATVLHTEGWVFKSLIP